MSQAALSASLRAALLAAPATGALDNAGLTAFCDAFAASFWPYLSMIAGTGLYFTPEGGLAITLNNGTGSASVKGSVVSAASGAFVLQTVEYDSIGVVYDAGIANGQPCRVVVSGVADVLFKDGVAPVAGYWVFAADTDGRADNLSAPPGGTIAAIDNHFKEVGHCIESKFGGTNVLAKCVLHQN